MFRWDEEGSREKRKDVKSDGDVVTLQAWDLTLHAYFPESAVWLCWTTEHQIKEVLLHRTQASVPSRGATQQIHDSGSPLHLLSNQNIFLLT